MRILQLVAIKGKGGTGASVVSLTCALALRGHRVWVVCRKSSDVARRLLGVEGVSILPGFLHLAKGISPVKVAIDLIKLTRLIKKERIEIIHSHSSPDGRLAWILKLIFPHVRVIRTRHIPMPINDRVQCRFVDVLVAVSHSVKWSLGIGCAQRCVVIYDAFSGGVLRRDYDFVVRNIARYERVKGLEFFVKALSKVNRLVKVKAEVVGRKNREDNPYYLKLLSMLDRCGLRGVLDLKGFSNDIDYLYSAPFLVLTSVASEGSSRVAIEALHYGKALVYHKVGAVPEVCLHKKTGIGVAAGDTDALCGAILLLWKEPALRRRLGVNALKRRRMFTTERLFEDYWRIYCG